MGNVRPPNAGGGEGLSGQRDGGSNKFRPQTLNSKLVFLVFFFFSFYAVLF